MFLKPTQYWCCLHLLHLKLHTQTQNTPHSIKEIIFHSSPLSLFHTSLQLLNCWSHMVALDLLIKYWSLVAFIARGEN